MLLYLLLKYNYSLISVYLQQTDYIFIERKNVLMLLLLVYVEKSDVNSRLKGRMFVRLTLVNLNHLNYSLVVL